MFDYIILGAGPAGIQLAYDLNKSDESYLVLEGGKRAGTFFETYPRHRTLISINKRNTGSNNPEFNLRHDWNSLVTDESTPLFTQFDRDFFPCADNMVTYLNQFVIAHKLNVQYDQRINSIKRDKDGFVLTSETSRFFCRRLIVATGVSKPFIPDIEGIELVEQYATVSLDRNDFENQRVLVIGKGNSAFETADHLISSACLIHICSPNPLTMAWTSHYVGNLRAVNNNFLDTYQLKSQNAVLDADIRKISKKNGQFEVQVAYAHADSESEIIYYDRVVCCTGFGIDASIFDQEVSPELLHDSRFPKLTAEFESTNVKGLFFAGTLTQSLSYKKASSGFVHGFRYNSRSLAQILKCKYDDQPIGYQTVRMDARQIARAMLLRINQTSALWLQHGFMVDAVVFDQSIETCRFYGQMPKAFMQQYLRNEDSYLLLTLDYGAPIQGDPFNQPRVHKDNAAEAGKSKFLHPIIYLCSRGEVVKEHHIIEDLEADWTDDGVHFEPLVAFIQHEISKISFEPVPVQEECVLVG